MTDDTTVAQLSMRTVVLVGRQDFGRCPLAASQPAALWPIADRPVLSRLLDHLVHEGIKSAVVCCGDEASASVEAACEGAAIDVKVLTEDLTKGTAGCLRDAVASDPGDLLIVLSGSMVLPPSISFLAEAHRAGGADLTMVFNPSQSDGSPYGSPAEIYLCDPVILQHISIGGYSDIKEELIPSILRAGGSVHPVVLPNEAGNFRDRDGYLEAVALYLKTTDGAEDGFALHDRSEGRVVATASSASIHETARVYGPVAIGDQAQLLEDTMVVGPAIIGSQAVVGAGSTVVGSVLWKRARVGTRCEIRQSVVAQDVVVPDGATVAEQAVSGQGRISSDSPWAEGAVGADRRNAGVLLRRTVYIGAGMAIGLAFLWSYWPTLAGLWRIWRASDEYSAGLLVPFLAAYVLWTRRRDLTRVPIRPALISGTALFILAQAMRSFGLRRMYASAERLSIIVSVAAIALLLFGRRFLWRLVPILLFLCLMLPWPNRIQNKIGLPLQSMATDSAVFCLELIGTDVQQDGNVIKIGDTRVEVAKACNGLSMIMAFFVISGLVALLARRAWWEKLIVLMSSLPVALCCNTLRLTVTALLFTVVESKWLEQLSHDFGGYAMMPLALALMVGELWLLARLTNPPVEMTPEVITRRKPRRVPGS